MRREASLEQWNKLYEVGAKLKDLKPWEFLWDMDLITIMLPDRDEPCFCSVLGRGGDCFGINTFIGYDGLSDYMDIINIGSDDMSMEYVMNEQSNLSCFWGNREEVPSKQKKLIKELGLKFRGRNQWLYFESYKKGYIPYILDEEETVLLTQCLNHLYMALQVYLDEEIKVNFENGQTLVHEYDKKQQQWTNYSAPLPFLEREYPLLILQDEILKAKMKRQPKVNAVLELDMVYMNAYVKDKNYDRPVNPKILILMDEAQEMVIAQDMLTPGQDEDQAIINMTVNFIMQYGRMKRMVIRNPYIESLLKDTCEYCDISLQIQEDLPLVDSFINEFRMFHQ